MLLGILSDTHELERTRTAVAMLQAAGVRALIHCGDLASPPILAACAVLPVHFVFGNHDADSVPLLRQAAMELGAVCLNWGGIVECRQEDRRDARAHDHGSSQGTEGPAELRAFRAFAPRLRPDGSRSPANQSGRSASGRRLHGGSAGSSVRRAEISGSRSLAV